MRSKLMFPLAARGTPKFTAHKYTNLSTYRKKHRIPRGSVYLRLCNLELKSIHGDLKAIVERHETLTKNRAER